MLTLAVWYVVSFVSLVALFVGGGLLRRRRLLNKQRAAAQQADAAERRMQMEVAAAISQTLEEEEARVRAERLLLPQLIRSNRLRRQHAVDSAAAYALDMYVDGRPRQEPFNPVAASVTEEDLACA